MAYNHPTTGSSNIVMDFDDMLRRSREAMTTDNAAGGPPTAVEQPMPGPGAPPSVNPQNPFAGALGPAAIPLQFQEPPVADLPPQAFLTSSMLLDFVDKKVMVILRDETAWIGVMRSYDQYGNLVMMDVVERISAKNPAFTEDSNVARWLIADEKQPGVMIIRGENVGICFTIDLDMEDDPPNAEWTEPAKLRKLRDAQKAEQKEKDAKKAKIFKNAGIEPPFDLM